MRSLLALQNKEITESRGWNLQTTGAASVEFMEVWSPI